MKTMKSAIRTEPVISTWPHPDATTAGLHTPAQASGLRSWASTHSLVLYFVLAYFVAWAVEIPLASTGGSVLLAGLFHAVFNLVTASPAGGDLTTIALNAGPFIGAVLIVLLCKPEHLSWAHKQVAS